MQNISDFKVVTLKNRPDAKSYHQVFMKKHSVRAKDPEKPVGKTLFLLNIPPYVNEDSLKFAFRDVGAVETVIFEYKSKEASANSDDKNFNRKPAPFQFKFAYVVFKSTKSLEKALALDELTLYEEGSDTIVVSGVKKWMQDYESRISDEATLQAEIDSYMADYDKKQQASTEVEKEGQVDEEGWTVVTKRGKNAGFEQKESVINKLEEKAERSRKNRELTNFYTFQIRESKMKHIVSLRQKFEEDKKKIETMKKSRRFNPFK